MNSRPYTVHIYEGEARLISNWTLQYPNIETGGDLFGLWLNENEVVIQAVLGPGQNCRRTTTSFFQDEQYLSNVGGLLTHNQGLCNVGSWHSHHTMNIPDPSRGDRDTVWRHLPTPGRFLLLIATIETKTGTPKVKMGFNLFESTSEGNKMVPMKLEILQKQSPIRANNALSCQMLEGAEVYSKKKPYPERPEVNKESRAGRPELMRSIPGHDDSSGVSRDQLSGPQQHRRPPNQNTTCDGVRLSFRNPGSHSNDDSQRRTIKYHDAHNGRQKMIIYHGGHPLGHCEHCYDTLVYKQHGRLYVQHVQGDIDCCTIL